MSDNTGLIHHAFQDVVQRWPDNVAIIDGNKQVTYKQLDALSDRYALLIKERLAQTDGTPLVGVYLPRGIALIATLIGVLKAGGAYVPLDDTFPAERLNYITADSGMALLVTTADMGIDGWADAPPVALLEEADNYAATALPRWQAAADATPAYIIYTSGSTGKPKGVVISHHNLLRLMDSSAGLFEFNEQDRWSLFHSIAFDFSVWEMWGPLLTGGALVVVSYSHSRTPEAFWQLIREHKITVLNQTASAFRLLSEIALANNSTESLRYVIFGGEKLDLKILRPWTQAFGMEKTSLINMYGITEVTVHSTFCALSEQMVMQRDDSPIGSALPDLTIFLLDEQGKPVADGEPGIMYIAGPGVALGYLNRPELTAQRFITFTPADRPAVRAYNTGDMVYQSAKGELIYLRRADNQIKVRGFRIEPEEIEMVFNAHPAIKNCLVNVFDYGDNDFRLAVFYELNNTSAGDEKTLLKSLQQLNKDKLPQHMRVSEFIAIDNLPINGNGKLDRKLLKRSPKKRNPSMSNIDTLVKTHTIVSNLLGNDKLDVNDDFFDVGGTSLTLLRVVAELNKTFNAKLDLGQFADGITVSKLATAVSNN